MPTLNNETRNKNFSVKDDAKMQKLWKNAKKYEREGLSLNISKARYGRKRTVRTKETIEVVTLYVKDRAINVSCRGNVLAAVLLTK